MTRFIVILNHRLAHTMVIALLVAVLSMKVRGGHGPLARAVFSSCIAFESSHIFRLHADP